MLKKCPKNVEFLSPHPLGLGVVCLFAHSLAHPDSPFSPKALLCIYSLRHGRAWFDKLLSTLGNYTGQRVLRCQCVSGLLQAAV